MLVLSRRIDETIVIGDDIEVKVVDIRGDKVRLGITAPSKVPVHRKEVYDAIQLEMEADGNPGSSVGSLAKPPQDQQPGDETQAGNPVS